MSDKPIINLEDIANKLEEKMENWEQYLNIMTGEFFTLPDDTFFEIDREQAEEIENSPDYVRLPNQYEIDEYTIMTDFAEKTKDVQVCENLLRSLNGKHPFRHFKDALIIAGLREKYYAFRKLAFLEIARAWCEENNIAYNMFDQTGG